MAQCDIQPLLDENPCLGALNPWMLEVVKTQILCNIVNFLEMGDAVTCDIQTLLDDAQCFYAVSPGLLSVVQVQLLCNISSAIGAGGVGGGILETSGNPEGVLTATAPRFAWDSTAQIMYLKDTGSGDTGWIIFASIP